MGMIAVYLQISDETLKSLKKLDNKDLFESLEKIQEKENCERVDIGKIWDGLHFLLTEVSASQPIYNDRLSEFVVGVNVFSDDENADFISYTTSDELKRILIGIDKINFTELENFFSPTIFKAKRIYPNIWRAADKKELFNELKDAFNSLKNFYSKNLDSNIVVSIY